jgi:hypothetical protein
LPRKQFHNNLLHWKKNADAPKEKSLEKSPRENSDFSHFMFFSFGVGIDIDIHIYSHLPTNVRLTLKFRVGELKKSTRHRYTPPSVSFTFRICSRESFGESPTEKYSRCPKSLARAAWVAAFKATPVRESRLYNGMPVASLNHNTSLTLSLVDGDVVSQGSSASLSMAAHTTRAGTGTNKERQKN